MNAGRDAPVVADSAARAREAAARAGEAAEVTGSAVAARAAEQAGAAAVAGAADAPDAAGLAPRIAAMLRRLVRFPAVLALLFAGLATVMLAFPLSRESFRRGAIRLWSRALCACCGLRFAEFPGPGARPLSLTPPGRLVVANHISWLDVFAIDARCPMSFVAKAEIARWPLIGTLVARTGTLFIERGRRRAVHRMIEHIDMALRAGARVAVFPEGTTGDGSGLLPFHANLVQAALVAQAPVVPVGLRYLDRGGARSRAVEYVGETTFVASLWRILGAPPVRCELHPLEELSPRPGETRHALAERAREAIAVRLGLPAPERVQDRGGALRGG